MTQVMLKSESLETVRNEEKNFSNRGEERVSWSNLIKNKLGGKLD